MPAEPQGADDVAAEPRIRSGPRHAAPKKPLLTRLHMPTGRAIALAAMPTAVLMGVGMGPLAQADGQDPKRLTAEEYQACVEALEVAQDGADGADKSAEPSVTPSPSASETADDGSADGGSTDGGSTDGGSTDTDTGSGDTGSDTGTDTGSGTDTPAPTPTTEAPEQPAGSTDTDAGQQSAEPAPSESETSNPLDPLGIGDALGDLLTGGEEEAPAPAPSTATPTPTATPSASDTDAPDPVQSAKDTVEDTTGTVEDTAEDVTDTVDEAGDKAEEAASEAPSATATPSPSASESADPEDCPVATDAEGEYANAPQLPDRPWRLEASSLLLKGADYQGIVEVRTANGTVKKVLKYVISDGTEIGDLHQLVKDEDGGKTYHVQAAKGSKSTITNGKTTMYTEKISGKLFGLIPVTFSPESPPPLNIPLIYFTDVEVTQAGQFGGDLHVPGLHQFITD
ncbi:hypothetical protein ACIQ6Y_24985 [Streptomyces sp. NPDC096205]|uniref:hypothetical protein n=1 Tax=Streptomyces sp. NPDC096205 TaxID=3366081 RepID=UPI00382634FF